MPNHVRNLVKMQGITALPVFTEKEGWDKRMVMSLDFDKIIPMPESLDVVSGTMEAVAVEAAIRKAASVAGHRFSGPKFALSMTDAEYRSQLSRCSETEDELCKLGLQYIQNMILHGAPTWYDWCIEHWGTKWNAYENEQIDKDTIAFETASGTLPSPMRIWRLSPPWMWAAVRSSTMGRQTRRNTSMDSRSMSEQTRRAGMTTLVSLLDWRRFWHWRGAAPPASE